jgi:hypothetical protein
MTRIAAQMMICVALAITELYAIHAAGIQRGAPARPHMSFPKSEWS